MSHSVNSIYLWNIYETTIKVNKFKKVLLQSFKHCSLQWTCKHLLSCDYFTLQRYLEITMNQDRQQNKFNKRILSASKQTLKGKHKKNHKLDFNFNALTYSFYSSSNHISEGKLSHHDPVTLDISLQKFLSFYACHKLENISKPISPPWCKRTTFREWKWK